MEISEYRNIFENEEKHFFYVSTHNLVQALIERNIKKKRGLKILDAGSGTGGLMKRLSKYGEVVGVDYNKEAIKYAKKRGLVVERASIDKLPFKGGLFDLVTCIDVIYHLKVADDVGALSEIKRVLKPGGILIIRVPANKFLMSAHDRHVHTARRYSKVELAKKLRRGGLIVKKISYVHSPIFLISLIRVGLERITNRVNNSSVGLVNSILNRLLIFCLNIEARLITSGLSLSFGQGLIAVAIKKG